MKQIKSILLIAAALVSLTACHNHLDLTPDGWLTELSSNRVFAKADVNGLDNVTKAATTATTASLDAGFNVFASNVKNEPIWNYEFTADGEGHFTNENAMWVKAGKMTFRAVYPKDLTIGNDGTIGPDNYVNNWFLEKDPLVAVTTTSPSSRCRKKTSVESGSCAPAQIPAHSNTNISILLLISWRIYNFFRICVC